MSPKPTAGTSEPAVAGSDVPVFEYNVRREGRVVAALRAHQTPGGITVETEVTPTSAQAGAPPISRPFPFPSIDHARRFADEALIAFEYLNCTIT